MNKNLFRKSKLGSLLSLLLVCLSFNLLNCSEFGTLSQESDISSESSEHNAELYSRPEGASSLKFRKSIFDKFKKETTIDKYITKEGKKVKVKLIRKHRPIFEFISRWYSKRRAKNKAKKESKQKRKKLKRKGGGLGFFSRFRKQKNESENHSPYKSKSEVSRDIEETSNDSNEVFEEGSIKSDTDSGYIESNLTSPKIGDHETSESEYIEESDQ